MTAITVISGYVIPDTSGGSIAPSHNSGGSFADNSFADGSPPNGTIGIDGSNNQLCVRINGAWYGVALTALTNVFEIDAITVAEVVTVSVS